MLPEKVTRLLDGKVLFPGVVDAHDGHGVEAGLLEDVGKGAAVSERIDRPGCLWSDTQVIQQPLVTYSKLRELLLLVEISDVLADESNGKEQSGESKEIIEESRNDVTFHFFKIKVHILQQKFGAQPYLQSIGLPWQRDGRWPRRSSPNRQ